MGQDTTARRDAPDRLPSSVLRLLAPERRRAVMRALMEEPNATHRIEDIVNAIEETYGDIGEESSNCTYLRSSLHHTHLPKLDDAEVVEYDPDDGTVQYRGDPHIEQWVDQIDRIDED
ncbi:DUF7344 domain-containing protein [Halomicrobium zhouii]|nr:hypothetical protein [Halomicrobium zhouii]